MTWWQQNSVKDMPISPRLMKLLNKTYVHQRALIPMWKVSKTIRKKMLKWSCECQRTSNDLNVNKGDKVQANQNKGHLSYDHGFKHNTSSTDLPWLASRIGFHLDSSTMLLLSRVNSLIMYDPLQVSLNSHLGSQTKPLRTLKTKSPICSSLGSICYIKTNNLNISWDRWNFMIYRTNVKAKGGVLI